MSVVVVVD